MKKMILILTLALAVSGCETLGAVGNVGVDLATGTAVNAATAAQTSGIIADKQMALALAHDPVEIARLCADIAVAVADRNAAWEYTKGAGGLLLRGVGLAASVAGLSIAAPLGIVSATADGVADTLRHKTAALTTGGDAKCEAIKTST